MRDARTLSGCRSNAKLIEDPRTGGIGSRRRGRWSEIQYGDFGWSSHDAQYSSR